MEQSLHCLWVSPLSDDSCELHLTASVHLKPVVGLLWFCTPCTSVQVLLVIWGLQQKTAELSLMKLGTDVSWVKMGIYLHVESSSLSCEAVMWLRGGQQLVLLHPVRLQTQRRTLWGTGKQKQHAEWLWFQHVCVSDSRKHFNKLSSRLTFRFNRHGHLSQPLLLLLLPLLPQPLSFIA